MKKTPGTSASTRGTTGPATRGPMNLTCTTVPTSGRARDNQPSLVKIVIDPQGRAQGPDAGWKTFVSANPEIEYELHDKETGEKYNLSGDGIAIYYKD